MMKGIQATYIGLGILLVVPAFGGDGSYADNLQAQLDRTIRALEGLVGIEHDLGEGDESAIDAILAWTEPAPADAATQEAQLVGLRADVHELQMRVDSSGGGSFLTPPPTLGPAGVGTAEADRTPLPPTTGLSNSDRLLLLPKSGLSGGGKLLSAPTGQGSTGAGQAIAFENEEYAADSLGLAKVLFRQARFEEALRRIGTTDEPEALYWRARCLEKLGRDRDALEVFRLVAEMPEAGATSESARHHAEFLDWKIEFLAKQSEPDGGGS